MATKILLTGKRTNRNEKASSSINFIKDDARAFILNT